MRGRWSEPALSCSWRTAEANLRQVHVLSTCVPAQAANLVEDGDLNSATPLEHPASQLPSTTRQHSTKYDEFLVCTSTCAYGLPLWTRNLGEALRFSGKAVSGSCGAHILLRMETFACGRRRANRDERNRTPVVPPLINADTRWFRSAWVEVILHHIKTWSMNSAPLVR